MIVKSKLPANFSLFGQTSTKGATRKTAEVVVLPSSAPTSRRGKPVRPDDGRLTKEVDLRDCMDAVLLFLHGSAGARPQEIVGGTTIRYSLARVYGALHMLKGDNLVFCLVPGRYTLTMQGKRRAARLSGRAAE